MRPWLPEPRRSSCTPVPMPRQPARVARRSCTVARAAGHAAACGLIVNAGHGLDYHNVQPVAALPEVAELNIGHAIVSRALFSGLASAVSDMKRLMREARAR
jgi:pyridoxine 5-phosphate synthase